MNIPSIDPGIRTAFEQDIIDDKQIRVDIDAITQRIKDQPASRERSPALIVFIFSDEQLHGDPVFDAIKLIASDRWWTLNGNLSSAFKKDSGGDLRRIERNGFVAHNSGLTADALVFTISNGYYLE